MNSYLSIEHCGETLWLLPDKAIYWPARRALLVADVHIGKAASYRALHQPVPRGTTAATLARLDTLLNSYDCEQLVILGDFLHARAAHSPGILASLRRWKNSHSALRVVLVRGNHDRDITNTEFLEHFNTVVTDGWGIELDIGGSIKVPLIDNQRQATFKMKVA